MILIYFFKYKTISTFAPTFWTHIISELGSVCSFMEYNLKNWTNPIVFIKENKQRELKTTFGCCMILTKIKVQIMWEGHKICVFLGIFEFYLLKLSLEKILQKRTSGQWGVWYLLHAFIKESWAFKNFCTFLHHYLLKVGSFEFLEARDCKIVQQ